MVEEELKKRHRYPWTSVFTEFYKCEGSSRIRWINNKSAAGRYNHGRKFLL